MDPTTIFLDSDHRRWIFPLRTPVLFAATDAPALRKHIQSQILNPSQPEGFVAGQVAFSRKDEHHLRRVLVLDPFTTFFLYDFAHTNRSKFPRLHTAERYAFGHCFHRGKPVDGFADYHLFRRKKYELAKQYGHFAQVDVFNCFNSFYHHEVAAFVSSRLSAADGEAFGQFLRELNAGVSVSCFPQGLYPAKVIGNAYLSFVEQSSRLVVPGLARFLDDIVLAGASRADLEGQVLELQYILDKHHLSLNDAKTHFGERGSRFQERKLDRIKRDLVRKRELVTVGYDGDEDQNESGLTEEEKQYVVSLIRGPNVAQEDIELALALLRNEEDALEYVLRPVIDRAPHLLRGLHRFVGTMDEVDESLWDGIVSRLKSPRTLPEHDLFWYARLLIDYYDFDKDVADLLIKIYQHPGASPVVKAAILETESITHGFDDLKETALRSDGNLLTSSAAMVGLAKLTKAKRNHVFKYVANRGSHFAVLMKIAGKMAG
jgi:hypothetical protein